MKHKLLLITAALLLCLLNATPVMAQSESSVTNTRSNVKPASRPVVAPVRQQVQEQVGARIDDKCERIENRLDAISTRYDLNKDRHLEQYQKTKNDFANLMKVLTAKDYDVTKLQADAKVLDEKIVKFGRDYDAYVVQMKKAQQLACGQSQGSFKTELDGVHQALRVVRADAQDIRQYYQTVIKVDIQTVRQQKLHLSSSPTP